MKYLTGKCVSNQIVIAPLLFMGKAAVVNPLIEEAAEDACERVMLARRKAVSFCSELIRRAEEENNKDAKAIFEAQEVLLQDEMLEETIVRKIKEENLNAVTAVVAAGEEIKESLVSLGDDMVAARRADVEDVVSYYLQGMGVYENGAVSERKLIGKVIVMAPELTPAETMRLPKKYVAGFVTRDGSSVSHVSILAGSLGIPALYGADVSEEYDGQTAILDGEKNCLIVNPDEETLCSYQEKMQLQRKTKETDGKTINDVPWKKYANVTGAEDARKAFANGAQGIGLYRSECLFLGQEGMPTEEEQFAVYKELLEAAEGREVVIRVLDAGSDKQCPYLKIPQEKNPALGLRGIRYLFANPDVLETQLRALYRASDYGNLSILFPMITSLEEVKRIKEICEKFQGNVRIGMMIETPAAALITDLIAGECDFISIGTNDLLQYLMAADREGNLADTYLTGRHPAVNRILKQIVSEAHAADCEVCICGELAANKEMEPLWEEWKVDVLSVVWKRSM